MTRARTLAALAMLATLGTGCAPRWKATPHDQLFQHEPPPRGAADPRGRDPSDWWDHGTQALVRPLGRVLSPGRWISAGAGGRAALDTNEFGQVPDSAWFENRIARRPISAEEAERGATRTSGPAPGQLAVISGKLEGASPGFVVRDTAGITWYLKLDAPAFPELSTSAEVVASRLLWLAGYHVPENHALDLDPKRFVLDPRARTRDKRNRDRPMTAASLDELIRPLNTDAAGRVRIMASRQPDGVVLGPWDYRGRALDDPNDLIDHERRRSLRGLWLFAAWINNVDTRNQNTLDVLTPTTPDGRGVLRHYLLDFGDSFGATGTGEKTAGEGFQYVLDWVEIGANLIGAGFRVPRWQAVQRSPFRSVGLFEARRFQAGKWVPRWPNPAFDDRTRADVFWAGSILARIQPAHVRAAVAAASYHEDGAAIYVAETLLERRRKLLEHAFAGFLEVDQPRIREGRLVLDDLRVIGGLPPRAAIAYTVRWNRTRRGDVELARGSLAAATAPAPTVRDANVPDPAALDRLGELRIDLAPVLAAIARLGPAFADDPFISVELTRARAARATVHLRVEGGRVIAVALAR